MVMFILTPWQSIQQVMEITFVIFLVLCVTKICTIKRWWLLSIGHSNSGSILATRLNKSNGSIVMWTVAIRELPLSDIIIIDLILSSMSHRQVELKRGTDVVVIWNCRFLCDGVSAVLQVQSFKRIMTNNRHPTWIWNSNRMRFAIVSPHYL